MKELVETIARAIVTDPEAVSVTMITKGNLEVYCQCNSYCCKGGCFA